MDTKCGEITNTWPREIRAHAVDSFPLQHEMPGRCNCAMLHNSVEGTSVPGLVRVLIRNYNGNVRGNRVSYNVELLSGRGSSEVFLTLLRGWRLLLKTYCQIILLNTIVFRGGV